MIKYKSLFVQEINLFPLKLLRIRLNNSTPGSLMFNLRLKYGRLNVWQSLTYGTPLLQTLEPFLFYPWPSPNYRTSPSHIRGHHPIQDGIDAIGRDPLIVVAVESGYGETGGIFRSNTLINVLRPLVFSRFMWLTEILYLNSSPCPFLTPIKNDPYPGS